MNLVIPITRADFTLALPLARQLVSLGGLHGHRLTVMCTPEVQEQAGAFSERVCHLFADSQFSVVPNVVEAGWPRSANSMFLAACNLMLLQKEPWYFFEADNAPLCEGWLDRIASEYDVGGKPYMGVIRTTWARDPAGAAVAVGRHMVGTGIYPSDVVKRIKLLQFLSQIPFDVFIENYTVKFAHHTELIQHNWGTARYRRQEDGQIVCEDVDPSKVGGDPYNNPLRSDAVVLHGCKDGSIYKVLNNEVLTPVPKKRRYGRVKAHAS